jgi:hypothetical protein
MQRTSAAQTALLLALATAVGGCATQRVLEARDALHGQDLQTAINLYGRFDERVSYGGKAYYLWRRAVSVEGTPHVCELRVELGYRNIIRDTLLEGYPAACGMFSVEYSSDQGARRKREDRTKPAGPETVSD